MRFPIRSSLPKITALLSIVLTFSLTAETIHSPSRDFFIDPPEDWEFLEDPTPDHLVMTDPAHEAVFQVLVRPLAEGDVMAAGTALMQKLKARGDHSTFDWHGSQAWLGALEFVTGPGPVQGWGLLVPWKGALLTVLAFAPAEKIGLYSDALNSAFNSLALGEDGRRKTGPLSRYYELTTLAAGTPDQVWNDGYDLPALPPNPAPQVEIKLPGSSLRLPFPQGADESAQVLIERESRLLMKVPVALIPKAWPRFYRQIFREIYTSLLPLAEAWETRVREGTLKPQDLPQAMLTWLQNLKYSRKGGISDLSTPWETLKTGEGDCDSRALIYAGLMHHFGYSTILMVSSTYGHGMAAVDISGPGAKFPFQNRQWLVAELTAKVSLGQIPQDMADPGQWLGVNLLPQP